MSQVYHADELADEHNVLMLLLIRISWQTDALEHPRLIGGLSHASIMHTHAEDHLAAYLPRTAPRNDSEDR
jgi:hypothetical protein